MGSLDWVRELLHPNGSHVVNIIHSGLRNTLSGHSDTVRAIVSISSMMFATCSSDTTLRIWDSGTADGVPKCVHILRGHSAPVTSLAFDRKTGLLASAGRDDSCRIWRPRGTCVAVLNNDHTAIYTPVFASSPGGKAMVITGGNDGHLTTWNATTGVRLQTLEGHTEMVRMIVSSRHRSDWLFSADVTGTIIAWTYQNGWRLVWKVPEAHEFSVSALCVKGGSLLTAGADGKIRIRDLETGSLHRDIGETYDTVYDTTFQDNTEKSIIAIASRNGRALVDVSKVRSAAVES